MTRDNGEVTDALFEEVRTHFDEPQVVEMACVIGLFNYFNRFNNALRMPVTLGDIRLLLSRMRASLADAPGAIVDALRIVADGRRLACLAIYRGEGPAGVPVAAVGEAPPHPPGPEAATACAITLPVTAPSGLTTGMLLATAAAQRHLDDEDHELLRQVAALLGEVPEAAGG